MQTSLTHFICICGLFSKMFCQISFTGNSYQDLQYLYRVARNTISQIVPETCAAIYDALCSTYVKVCDTVFTNWYMSVLEVNQNYYLPNFEDHVMVLDH